MIHAGVTVPHQVWAMPEPTGSVRAAAEDEEESYPFEDEYEDEPADDEYLWQAEVDSIAARASDA